jgi:aspartyl-tRNA(Asn)/glutamyl-tRNA(Gln) amidotransferase subunit A
LFFQEVPDFASQFSSINLLESKPLKGLRVGLIRETIDEGVDTGVISAIRGAASHLEELGCSVTEVCFLLFIFFTTFACSNFSSSLQKFMLILLMSFTTFCKY